MQVEQMSFVWNRIAFYTKHFNYFDCEKTEFHQKWMVTVRLSNRISSVIISKIGILFSRINEQFVFDAFFSWCIKCMVLKRVECSHRLNGFAMAPTQYRYFCLSIELMQWKHTHAHTRTNSFRSIRSQVNNLLNGIRNQAKIPHWINQK